MTINLTPKASFVEIERDGVIVALVPKGDLNLKPKQGLLSISAPDFHEELSPAGNALEIGGVSAGATLADWLTALAEAPGFSAVGGLTAGLSTEIADREAADTNLQTELDANATADAAETAARANEDAVLEAEIAAEAVTRAAHDATETTLRTNADNALSTSIATETTNRTNADTTEANTRATADTTEANTRAAQDVILAASVATETTNRTNADTTEANTRAAADTTEANTRAAQDVILAASVATETTNRTNADTTEANTRAAADTTEANARAAQDVILAASVATETTNRTNADTTEATTRATADTTEAATRAAADTALGNADKQANGTVSATNQVSTASPTYTDMPDMTTPLPTLPGGGTGTLQVWFEADAQIAVSAGAPFVIGNVAGSTIATSERSAGIITTGKNEKVTTNFTVTGVASGATVKMQMKSSGGAGLISFFGRSMTWSFIPTANEL